MNQIKRSYLCASFSTLTLWSWLPGSEEVRCHSCCSVLMVNVPAGNFVNMCLKLHFKTFFVSATNGKITCFVMGINAMSYQSAIDILAVHSPCQAKMFSKYQLHLPAVCWFTMSQMKSIFTLYITLSSPFRGLRQEGKQPVVSLESIQTILKIQSLRQ